MGEKNIIDLCGRDGDGDRHNHNIMYSRIIGIV